MNKPLIKIHNNFRVVLDFLEKNQFACNIEIIMADWNDNKLVLGPITIYVIGIRYSAPRKFYDAGHIVGGKYVGNYVIKPNELIFKDKNNYRFVRNTTLNLYFEPNCCSINGLIHEMKYYG